MARKERIYNIVVGILSLVVAVLSCVGTWLALPILQKFFVTNRNGTTTISFVTVTPTPKENLFQIYDVWFEPTDFPAYWQIDDLEIAKKVFLETENHQLYEDYFPRAVPVTLAGDVQLSFDVENIAGFSQINLSKLLLEVERIPLSEIQNVYMHPPGLGGGTIRNFQAVAEYDDAPNKPERQTIIAKPLDEENFDFITLSPGERETINLDIKLMTPGLYHITPIAEFNYREKHLEHRFDQYNLLVPENYRIWVVRDGQLKASSVVVNNNTGDIEVEDGQTIIPAIHPILFESSMINGMSSRIFILSGKRLTSPINEDLWQQGWQRELSDGWQAHWSEDGTQIVFKDQLWQVLNLLTGEISDVSRPHPENEIVPPLNVQKKLEYKYGDHYKVVSNSPDGRLFAIIVTNEQKETSGKIFIVDTTKFDLFEVSKNSANCSQPSWSPSGQKLAFICKPMVSETELWVITLPITEEAKLISTNQEDYLDPIWSEDDQQILVGGKALIVFNLDSTQSSTIMKTSFGYFSNPSWQPQN